MVRYHKPKATQAKKLSIHSAIRGKYPAFYSIKIYFYKVINNRYDYLDDSKIRIVVFNKAWYDTLYREMRRGSL